MKEGLETKSRELKKIKKESKRNNINSIGSNNSSVINISSSNNKFCVGRGWNNK